MIKTTNALHPLVFWAQTREQITLKVDLKDANAALFNATEKYLKFSSKGYGACGFNEYKFDLHFYDSIYKEQCSYRITDNKVEFVIKKYEYKWWPRLIAAPQKPHWLRIDFDRWRTEDEMIDDEKPRNIMEDYSKEFVRVQKEELGYLKGKAMKFCQLLQYLEVLHPIFGYTKGGALMPFFQVMGRNFILFVMVELEERMQTKPVIFYVFTIWSCIEIIRYPYYLTQLFKCEIFLLTWLRYSIWIPLYPMGILCEDLFAVLDPAGNLFSYVSYGKDTCQEIEWKTRQLRLINIVAWLCSIEFRAVSF
nr:very-long-chain (3R)-3-hydroxyacyl-CoA dehydratase isoform X6 [Bactrocera oleae]